MTWVSTTRDDKARGRREAEMQRSSPLIGRTTFSIDWSTSRPVSGTFPGVAHPYVGNDASRPSRAISSSERPTPGSRDPNSRNTGTRRSRASSSRSVSDKPFQIESPLAPALLLRVASPSGSHNQAFDCDKSVTFEGRDREGLPDDLPGSTTATGHTPTTPKTGRTSSARTSRTARATSPPVAPTSPAPICVAAETGDVISFRQGLKARFETPSCAPNNWPKDTPGHDVSRRRDPAFFTTYDFANDSRYVTLVITDITAFEGSGSTNVPVKYFAGFYATGWDVGPQTTGCPDNDPHPLGFGPKKRQRRRVGALRQHRRLLGSRARERPALQLRRARQLHRRPRRVS